MISSVIGLGKLGLPFALFLASKYQRVFCYDLNSQIINKLQNNKSPYMEPKTSEYLKKFKKQLIITKDFSYLIEKSDISHLVLPTPSQKNNSFSNQYLINCLEKISFVLLKKRNKKHIINITSTVMPGSCKNLFCKLLESRGLKKDKDFIITYNPHFIAQGTTIYNLENPDFILIGADSKNSNKLVTYYNKIYKKKIKILLLNTIEAEIAKISINSYITTKITFSNFISEVCENIKDVDASKVLDAIGKDHRIGNSYLGVGTKYSGPCFPRDNRALNYFIKDKTKHSLPSFIDKINNTQTGRLIRIIKKVVRKEKLKKFNIGIFGLTYKDKTSIIKDSQSDDLIKQIRKKYKKNINVYDNNVIPSQEYIENNNLSYFKNLDDFIKKTKILILMYPNKKFLSKIEESRNKIIIDCWNMTDERKTNLKIYKLGQNFI